MSLDSFVKKKEIKPKIIKEPIKDEGKRVERKPEQSENNKPIIENKDSQFGKKMKWVYNHDHDFSMIENKILKTISSPSEILELSIWTIWALNRDLVKNESEVDEIIDRLKKKYNIERIDENNHIKNWVRFRDDRNKLWTHEIDEKKNHIQKSSEEDQSNEEEIEEKEGKK